MSDNQFAQKLFKIVFQHFCLCMLLSVDASPLAQPLPGHMQGTLLYNMIAFFFWHMQMGGLYKTFFLLHM